MDQLTALRKEAQRLSNQVEAGRAAYKDLKALWRKLDALGVKRSVIAEWSGRDPNLITRELGPK